MNNRILVLFLVALAMILYLAIDYRLSYLEKRVAECEQVEDKSISLLHTLIGKVYEKR